MWEVTEGTEGNRGIQRFERFERLERLERFKERFGDLEIQHRGTETQRNTEFYGFLREGEEKEKKLLRGQGNRGEQKHALIKV